MEEQELINILKHCADLFCEIRMDWSDPRHECREGMATLTAAIKAITGEDYQPKPTREY